MASAPHVPRLFEPSPTEEAARALIRKLEADGAGNREINSELDALYEKMTFFSSNDIAMLEEAGLILEFTRGQDLDQCE